MADVNPVEVQDYLGGDYPASKENLIERAKSQGAPKEILDTLTRVPEKEYGNPADLTQEIT